MNQPFDEIMLEEDVKHAFNDLIESDEDGELIDIACGITESIIDIADNIQDLELEEAEFHLESEQEDEFLDEACFNFEPEEEKGRIF